MSAKTVPMSNWADELMVLLPGVSTEAAKQALRASFREFCVQSGAWTRELRPVDIKEGKSRYYLDPQPDASVLYILAIQYVVTDDANPTSGYSRFLNAQQRPYQRSKALQPVAAPVAYVGVSEEPGAFDLVPAVNVDMDQVLIPYVCLGPKEPFNDRFPYSFERLHFDKLLEGAASRLMMQSGRPYSNPIMAQYYARRFRAGMAAARDMSRREFNTSRSEFAFPYWGK